MCKHVMGNTPLWNRPSNDKYAFLCVFHTLLKGKKKRRSSSSQQQLVPTVSLHPVLPKRSRKMLLQPQIMSKLCTTTTTLPGDDDIGRPPLLLLWTPNGTPDSFWYLSPFGSPVMKFEAGCSVEEFRLDNSVSYAFDDDHLNL